MKADKLHKFMVFMMSVYVNTVMQMFGNITLTSLIFYRSQQSLRIKYFASTEVFLQI
jgi:hypothetical protein